MAHTLMYNSKTSRSNACTENNKNKLNIIKNFIIKPLFTYDFLERSVS
jgi:hypothetical protein